MSKPQDGLKERRLEVLWRKDEPNDLEVRSVRSDQVSGEERHDG